MDTEFQSCLVDACKEVNYAISKIEECIKGWQELLTTSEDHQDTIRRAIETLDPDLDKKTLKLLGSLVIDDVESFLDKVNPLLAKSFMQDVESTLADLGNVDSRWRNEPYTWPDGSVSLLGAA